MLLRQKQISHELYDKRLKRTEDLSNEIDPNNLIYKYKFGKEVNFDEISDPITFE